MSVPPCVACWSTGRKRFFHPSGELLREVPCIECGPYRAELAALRLVARAARGVVDAYPMAGHPASTLAKRIDELDDALLVLPSDVTHAS